MNVCAIWQFKKRSEKPSIICCSSETMEFIRRALRWMQVSLTDMQKCLHSSFASFFSVNVLLHHGCVCVS